MTSEKRLRFSVVTKSTIIEIERPNAFRASDDDPETMVVELIAWPSGPQCPTWVEIAVEAAHDTYLGAFRDELARRDRDGQNIVETVKDPETGETSERRSYTGPTHQMSQILVDYRRDLLCACIEGLSETEGMLWARGDGPWQEILISLGRWTRPSVGQEKPPEGEATAQAGVTVASSPA